MLFIRSVRFQLNNNSMAKYQICDLEEFLNDDTLATLDEYAQSMKAQAEKSTQIPEEQIYQSAQIYTPDKFVEGEITRMLGMTPGILPPTDR